MNHLFILSLGYVTRRYFLKHIRNIVGGLYKSPFTLSIFFSKIEIMRYRKLFFGLLFFLLISAEYIFDIEPFEAGFQELSAHRTTCTYNALQEFTDECRKRGAENIDPNLRLELAVRLSICEFVEAGVEYPEPCLEISYRKDKQLRNCYKECVAAFRAVPQFWTTYSGHYRKLRLLCYEELAPFLKDSILDLFLNVTRLYSQFFTSAERSSVSIFKTNEEVVLKIHHLNDLMSSLFDKIHQYNETVSLQRHNDLHAAEVARDTVALNFDFLNTMLTTSFQENLLNMALLQKHVIETQKDLHLFEDSFLFNSEITDSFFLKVHEDHDQLLTTIGSAQKSINHLTDTSGLLAFSTSNVLTNVDLLQYQFREFQDQIQHHFSNLKEETENIIDFWALRVISQSEFIGTEIMSSLAPYLAQIAAVSSSLELQIGNISTSATNLSKTLTGLEKRLSVVLEMSFSGLGHLFYPFFRFFKQLFMALVGYSFFIMLFRPFKYYFSFAQKRKSSLLSFVSALILGFLAALAAKLVLSQSVSFVEKINFIKSFSF